MKQDKLISIVIPVYNVKKYLERCVNDVIKQTYKNIEIILVDDGSTDGSSKLCDQLFKKDERIVVFHKKNGGLSDARNYGVRAANGNFITFIDSDDEVDPNYVETLAKIIDKYHVKIGIASHRILYKNGLMLDCSTGESGCIDSKTILKRLLYADGIDTSSWAKIFAKDILLKHPFPVGRVFEDAATTYLYIDSVDKIGLNSTPIYTYNYTHTDSISQKPFTKQKMDLITSTREMHDYIVKKYPDLEDGANRRLMYAYLSTLRQLALSPITADSIECQPGLWQYVKMHRKEILLDPNTPSRDIHALRATYLGYGFFKFELKVYEKLRYLLS